MKQDKDSKYSCWTDAMIASQTGDACTNRECPLHPSRYDNGHSPCSGRNRYQDSSKFVTDANRLMLAEETYVYISAEDDYDIAVDLDERVDEFEALKPFLAFLAGHICEFDVEAQWFNSFKHERRKPQGGFPPGMVIFDYVRTIRRENPPPDFLYIPGVVYLEDNMVWLDYWGTKVGTQFPVGFEYQEGRFHLRHFGIIENIPDDWDKGLEG